MASNRIYLDYAASTPIDKEVLKAMEPYFSEKYGNPGSLHSFGQEALAAVGRARETVERAIGLGAADFRNIIFTGSATEANNLALRGAVHTAGRSSRIIISSIEHESVLETAKDLGKEGVEVVYLPVSRDGTVVLETLKKSLNDRTVLVSVMHANNELGTIEPIKEIGKIVADFRRNKQYPLFHTDAVQAFQFLDCDVEELGVDLMTLSAHKIYGPKGIGALYVRGPEMLSPIVTGGGQEFNLRSGTESVPAIVGFGKAAELAFAAREKETKRIWELSEYFFGELKKIYPKVEINGGAEKLPNILNCFLPGEPAQELLIKMDRAGIAVSSGSACSARASKPSHVLQALGHQHDRVMESVRFSFGKFTTKEELTEALKRMRNVFR